MLTTNIMVEIQGLIENNRAGIRKLPGTVLRNEQTGETLILVKSINAEVEKMSAEI